MASDNRPLTHPPDQAERDRIVRDLDTTMLVEAAAGTGKTTCMVGRMVALLAEGRCSVDTLAAVTFTRKAAGELRSRFQVGLERQAQQAAGSVRERLIDAVSRIERCFIGTIHSFCGRMLRERPVEAGVEVGFAEIDEEADELLRTQAWEQYVAGLLAHDDPLLAELESLGLPIDRLQNAFLRFADYPDIDEWPVPSETDTDLEREVVRVRTEVERYLEHARTLLSQRSEERGSDELLPRMEELVRAAGWTDFQEPAEFVQYLERFRRAKVTQKCWPSRAMAKAEEERYRTLVDDVIEPLRRRWRERRYEPSLRILRDARAIYDQLRRQKGVLNYADLLLLTARLLREHTNVRRYFQRRFTHVLIDEFQDTDPIQAEVVLLLAATDYAERNWRRCVPRPGSLFVVGDPKQSIYRFRRADIVTYNQVKEIIRQHGAVVTLSANFRTIPPILDWVNRVFGPEFDARDREYSPEYVALRPGRPSGSLDAWTPLVRNSHCAVATRKEEIIDLDAQAIAAEIHRMLDRQEPIPRVGGGSSPATPGDFLIISWRKAPLAAYGRALRVYGIPYQITGGGALADCEELRLLYRVVAAATEPENPVALVAALRSAAFGISDTTLYDFRRAGGRFSYRHSVSESWGAAGDTLRDAFARLATYATWLSTLPPVAAMERIAGDLGLFALAASREDGNDTAGGLAKALELVRMRQGEVTGALQLVEYLGSLFLEQHEHDTLPARLGVQPAVRVMNLHKVKGLEAPVVFLACPYGDIDIAADLHVDRSQGTTRGYLEVRELVSRRPVPLAQPANWIPLQEKESQFQSAELLRLRYVAATRAGARLIVTIHSRKWRFNPWEPFAQTLMDVPALEVAPADAPVPCSRSALTHAQVSEACAAIGERWRTACAPSYATVAAKEVALGGPQQSADEGGDGLAAWGTVIHSLLEYAIAQPGADLRVLAQELLAELELDPALLEPVLGTVAAVQESSLWKRATCSPRCLVEVPFQVARPATTGQGVGVLRGVADLAFEEGGGWVIVDWKTSRRPAQGYGELVAHYRPQVEQYAQAWQEITGQPVRERGLYFTQTGEYVTV